jgi:hypothetical protein
MLATRPGWLVNAAVVAAVALAVAVTTLLVPTLEASFGARATSRITASWSASKATLGTPVTVHGRVTSRRLQARSVSLYVYLKSGWRRAATTTSGPLGYYTLKVPTDYYMKRPVQVRASGTSRAKPVSMKSRTFTVTPRYAPRGPATAWSRQTPGQERRFNPCATVTYRVNAGPPNALADVNAAIARVHEATGITFRYLGTTNAVPTTASGMPAGTNLVVAWTTQAATDGTLAPGDLSTDLLLTTAAAHDAQGAVRRITAAAVLMNTDEDDYGWQMRQSILIHEIGHIVGLGHTTDRDQRMNASVYPGESRNWGAGDLAGFVRVGIAEGCLTR